MECLLKIWETVEASGQRSIDMAASMALSDFQQQVQQVQPQTPLCQAYSS